MHPLSWVLYYINDMRMHFSWAGKHISLSKQCNPAQHLFYNRKTQKSNVVKGLDILSGSITSPAVQSAVGDLQFQSNLSSLRLFSSILLILTPLCLLLLAKKRAMWHLTQAVSAAASVQIHLRALVEEIILYMKNCGSLKQSRALFPCREAHWIHTNYESRAPNEGEEPNWQIQSFFWLNELFSPDCQQFGGVCSKMHYPGNSI